MSDLARMLWNDWQRNYRFSGGLSALFSCIIGTIRAKNGWLDQVKPAAKIEVVTFSVVPQMTTLWAGLVTDAIQTRPMYVLIGDCSGGLHKHLPFNPLVNAIPLLNYHHGEKIDFFLRSVCKAEYVMFCDDDIFLLDTIPWQWAIDQFEHMPDAAIVALLDQKEPSQLLKRQVPQPIGSCFIVRRKIWLEENLSFKIVYPPPSESYGWFYDTGGFAQVELIRRGYQIVIAPEIIQEHLIALEGMSSWALKIRKNAGNIRDNIIVDRSVRPEKVLRVILALRGMASLFSELFPEVPDPNLINPAFLHTAETICIQELLPSQVQFINAEVELLISRLRQRLLIGK